jgi:hypothetical protein|tara:strand:+ start:119 stop:775 length:657 start_codon:yes stop_codon:yes gene_type:complete
MKTENVSIATLLIDETLYPRHKLSEHNVRMLKDAKIAGANLPPIVVDRETKKVVDGWHRLKAFQALGLQEIEAIVKPFATERDMFVEAVTINAAHGYKLTVWDQARSIQRLREMGADMQVIAKSLAISPKRLEKLYERVGIDGAGEKRPLKRSVRHLTGKKMTDEQVAYNEGSAPGLDFTALLSQIIRGLEANSINLKDENTSRLFERMCELYHERMS